MAKTPPKNDAYVALEDFLSRYAGRHDRLAELKSEVKELTAEVNDDLKKMKLNGFDVKVLRTLMKISVETPAEREARLEEEQILNLYKQATDLE